MRKKQQEEENLFLSLLEWEVKLSSSEQKILAELGYNKPVLEKIFNKVLNSLKNKMLTGDLSSEYVRGAKASLLWFRSYFKDQV